MAQVYEVALNFQVIADTPGEALQKTLALVPGRTASTYATVCEDGSDEPRLQGDVPPSITK